MLARFVGDIEQVPPMYSALHAGGRRLHELARAGIAVEREPRRVRVHAFDLLECASPRLSVRVRCGSGTYVRSLAADVGEALGCGGHVEALVRTRVGSLRLEDAVPWAVIQAGDTTVLAAGVLPRRSRRRSPADRTRVEESAAGWPTGNGCRCPSSTPPGPRRPVSVPRVRRRELLGSARYRPRGCARFVSSMQIVRGLDQYRPDAPPSVVAQGTFDGIHLGHQAVIRTAVGRARALGVRPVAVTFDPNPLAILRPAEAPPELLPARRAARAHRGARPGGVPRHSVHGRVLAGRGRGLRAGRPSRAPRARGRSSSASTTRSGAGLAGPRSCSGAWPSGPGSSSTCAASARRRRRRLVDLDPRSPAGRRRSARGEPSGAALRDRGRRGPGRGPRARAGVSDGQPGRVAGTPARGRRVHGPGDVGRGVRLRGGERRGAAHGGRRDASRWRRTSST